jgi:hypothetical protein
MNRKGHEVHKGIDLLVLPSCDFVSFVVMAFKIEPLPEIQRIGLLFSNAWTGEFSSASEFVLLK